MRDHYLAVGASGRGHVNPKESGLKASTVAIAFPCILPPTIIAPRERQFEIKNKIEIKTVIFRYHFVSLLVVSILKIMSNLLSLVVELVELVLIYCNLSQGSW